MDLAHGRVHLWLRELRSAPGPALLLLHALGGSGDDWPEAAAAWPGPLHALDFSGHGRSARIAGGAYSAELLAGDADVALAAIGPACVAGAGLGAYTALLLAGARPAQVPAAVLLPGPGLDGGGPLPVVEEGDVAATPPAPEPAPRPGLPQRTATDPRALAWFARDVRPVDYAEAFGRAARRLLLVDDGGGRPPWWKALRLLPGVETHGSWSQALDQLAPTARS